MSPQLCGGGYANPPTGYCYFRQTTVVLTGTVEYHYDYGTFIHSGDIFSFTISTIDCYVYSLTGDPPEEGSGEGDSWSELPGDGPIVFVRSRYPDGASGSMLVTGVARDDEYGVSNVSFWVDGQVAAVEELRTGLYDPYTCNERPAVGCDANSRFEATVDVSALADGPHTLQVLATNGRVVDPIPTYYEIPFEVRNAGTCAADTTAPTVSLTAPAEGATVQGAVAVSCSASDAS
ncbi:MAG: Ig-like domain-containing protein, partial [Acidobacteriota bacterium]|nr:Ig-like domain-containing protein [Acidobacteriota bacterium]